MKKRSLTLSRESLTELTTDELAGVAAGAYDAVTSPLKQCVTQLSDQLSCRDSCNTCWCPSETC